MTAREQALLELLRKLHSFRDDAIASGFIEDSQRDKRWDGIRVDLIKRINAVLADHAAPQDASIRKDEGETVDADSPLSVIESATSPLTTPAGAAPASVSPPSNCVTDDERGHYSNAPNSPSSSWLPAGRMQTNSLDISLTGLIRPWKN